MFMIWIKSWEVKSLLFIFLEALIEWDVFIFIHMITLGNDDRMMQTDSVI